MLQVLVIDKMEKQKSKSLVFLSALLLSKTAVVSIYTALLGLNSLKLLDDRLSFFLPIFNVGKPNLIDLIVFLGITLEALLFSYTIKNLLIELNNRTRLIFALSFFISPLIISQLFHLIMGNGFQQIKLEFLYLKTNSASLFATIVCVFYVIYLSYTLIGKFKIKNVNNSIFSVPIHFWLFLFISASGYIYFITDFIVLFITGYFDQISQFKYLNRSWWLIIFSYPIVAFFILNLFIVLISIFLRQLKVEKKGGKIYFSLIFLGLILPISLGVFENQVMKILAFIFNFISSWLSV